MTIKIYKLTKDIANRHNTWARATFSVKRTRPRIKGNGKDKQETNTFCYRCGHELAIGDKVVSKTGHGLGHIYHKKCAQVVKII